MADPERHGFDQPEAHRLRGVIEMDEEFDITVAWGYVNPERRAEGWFIRAEDENSDRWAAEYFEMPDVTHNVFEGSDPTMVGMLLENIGRFRNACIEQKAQHEADLNEIESLTITDFIK